MSNVMKNKIVRIYRTERSDEDVPMGVSVEYAHPKYFNQPKRTVDFVITDRYDIELAYGRVGIPCIDFIAEALAEKEAVDVQDEEEIVEDVSTEEPPIDVVEETQEEESTEQEESVEDVIEEAKSPLDMAWFELKAHTKEVTGITPKKKAEALELLGLNE